MERVVLDKEGLGGQIDLSLKGKKILIVEDDSFLGSLLSQKIKAELAEANIFKSGEEAVAFIENNTPDIAILDIYLPGMDGMQVLEKLRANEKTKNMPAIVVSNAPETEYKDRSAKLGAEFIIKAMTTPYEIVDRMKEILKNQG